MFLALFCDLAVGFFNWGKAMINKYDTLDLQELITILNGRDVEIEIITRSCKRLADENLKYRKKIADFAIDYGLESHEVFDDYENEKESENTIFSKFSEGKGEVVTNIEPGRIFAWD